jgi:PAS domain S-box-containing protein
MGRKPTYRELEQRVTQLEKEAREQRRTGPRVLESEKQLQTIFDFVREGIGIIDKTGRVLKINRRILEVGGYSEEDIVGKRFQILKMFTPSSIAKMVSAFAKMAAGQQVPPFEVEAHTKSGERVDLEFHTSPLLEGEKLVGGVAVMRDITERKRAEEALRKAHDELEQLVYERTAQLTKANEYLKGEMEGRKHTERMLSETNVKLHILQRVTEAVHSTLDIGHIFKHITEGAVHSMGHTTAFIMLLDDENKSFEMKAFSTRQGLLPYIDKMLGFPLREFTFPADATPNALIRTVISGKIAVAKTLSEVAYPLISKKICSGLQKLRGTRNYIVAPIQVEGQVVGGLVITSSREEISKEELGMIELLARVASRAIENANLHRKAVQAKEELRASEERYRGLFENSTDFIYTLDLEGNFTDVNRAAEHLTGYTKSELLEMNFKDYTPKDDHESIFQAFNRIFTAGEPLQDFPLEVTVKDGAKKYFETSVTTLWEGEKITGFQGSSRDITARKQSEDDLKASQEYIRNIIDSSLDMIIAVDMNRCIVEFNKAAERTFGYRGEDVVGAMINILYADPKEGLEVHRTAVEKGQCVREILNRRKNGEVFPSVLSASTLFDAHGNVQGVMGVSHDITEQKRAEQQIRQSLREKEVMLREIHHRVKNNMQVISSLLKLQAAHIKDGSVLEMFAESQNRIRAMSLIHERLYRTDDFARIDFSEYARGLTRHLLAIYRATAPQVTLTVDIHDISLDINTAIPCGLIINELVTNCLKHAFPGGRKGTISVVLQSPKQATYELTVRDDGVGIPKGIDVKTMESLGLHLVAILAEDQLKGEIRVSRIGGTTIQIIFKVS